MLKLLKDIDPTTPRVTKTNIDGLDRVLGGGLVQGSTAIVAGTPGVGKSTILSQLCGEIAKQQKKILYVAGEESLEQIKQRFVRLNINSSHIYLIHTTSLEDVKKVWKEHDFDLVIVDSLQTIYSTEIKNMPGTPTQIRLTLMTLYEMAKRDRRTLIFIGQSTKSGTIAGASTLQHMVDMTLWLDRTPDCRILKVIKNRYGDADQYWEFDLASNGAVDKFEISEDKPRRWTAGAIGFWVILALFVLIVIL